MRTVSYFTHKDREVHVYKYRSIGSRGEVFYRASLDGEDLPVEWPNASELEYAIKRLLDEQEPE